jgi:ABC-type transport system involved in cytochrome bd biosynthesis fused ATPase/permease subunit
LAHGVAVSIAAAEVLAWKQARAAKKLARHQVRALRRQVFDKDARRDQLCQEWKRITSLGERAADDNTTPLAEEEVGEQVDEAEDSDNN